MESLSSVLLKHRAGTIWHLMLPILRIFAIATGAIGLASCSDGSDNIAKYTVPIATVFGPVTEGSRGFPGAPAVEDLEAAGFTEEEFFLEGTARAFEKVGDWSIDGKWTISDATVADYRTRLLVRRPIDPNRFSGVVIVEWFNVTSGVDLDVDFGFLAKEILRKGHAWVGVSAQSAGIESSGGSPLGEGVVGLRLWDPVRYDSLYHPGDSYSYDIFSQAGATLKSPAGINPLGGLRPQIILADGESQSAFRMLTYVNAIHRYAAVYDGYLVHSRNGTGAPLNENLDGNVPAPAQIRTDIGVPVFQFITETDLFGIGEGDQSFPAARQPDSNSVHTWEVAGTAHADSNYLARLSEQGQLQYEGFLDLSGILDIVNTAPQNLSMNAALNALVTWVADGKQPPGAPPLNTADEYIVRDENGNALGGLRLPHIDVPIAVLSGEGVIPLSGSTVPFDTATLDILYPDARTYIEDVRESAQAAVDDGFLLPIDAAQLIAEAEAKPPVD
jgi:hypothetical protein